MPNNLQQMRLKLLQKESFKIQQKQPEMQSEIKLLTKLSGYR